MAAPLHEIPPQPPVASPAAPTSVPEPLASTRRVLVLLAGIALIAGLKFAQPVVVPVLFALFIALLLSPAVDFLVAHRVPRSIAAGIVVAALLGLVGASLNAAWGPARTWLDAAPTTLRQLERKLRPITYFIAKVESVSDKAGHMTEPATRSQDEPTPVALESKGFIESTQEFAITLISMFFLTFFLLATDLGALGARGAADSPWGQAGPVVLKARAELGRYFAAVALSNSMLGFATAAAMYMLDMPNPLLWGLTAFVLNFVPYAGAATTLTLLTIVALVSFDGVAKALAVAGTFLVLSTIEGQVVQPVLVGRRLDVSPLVVLIGLWFGGWMWGVAGVALAMPMVVSIKAALHEIRLAGVRDQQAVVVDTMRGRATELLRRGASRYRHPPGPP